MFEAVESPWLVPFDGRFDLKDCSTKPPKGTPKKKELEEQLEELVDEIGTLQRRLYAADGHAVLLVFQAMDAAGKDGTIRAVLSGIDPAGVQVYSFKAPSAEELDHDFLWRTAVRLPERGRIGVFNRSYYEEVLVVRVQPELLAGQRLPDLDPKKIWEHRFESIRDHEKHLARNGVVVVKFWLNVSKDEQRDRLLARLGDKERHWKFDPHDLDVRERWDAYMKAYEDALQETSRKHAPWYAIPADDKAYMRVQVATIVRDTLKSLGLAWPKPDEAHEALLSQLKEKLENE
jgi:PPK2 family polyphosphate:nucleotide phosphotransferase